MALRYVGRVLLTLVFLLCIGVLGLAASLPQTTLTSQGVLDPYPTKPRLVFCPDGTFKVTLFSDLHFGEGEEVDWGPEQDANSTRLMTTVLEDEQPDYVVLNGDLITGENTFRENSTAYIDRIMAPLIAARIPFSSVHGNHDNQANITHLEEIIREQEIAPLSYTRVAPPWVGGEGGPGNYWVPVYETSTALTPVLILWFFDSRGGFSPGLNSTPVPDWVDATVGEWIESESSRMEVAWGPAETRGALAFVHIPPHIIQDVQTHLNSTRNPGLNADTLGEGSSQATVDPSSAGNDAPFWNALTGNVKNLHAIFSGHDHGNEWCAREPTADVIFCFAKHSGYGGYDNPSWGNGVRNIVFSSPNPGQAVETWIRLEDGQTRARVVLNGNYLRR